MHIVVYSKPFFPSLGGLERNTFTLCQALLEMGHQVTLHTETPATETDTYDFPVRRTRSRRLLFADLGEADAFIVNGNVSMQTLPLALARGVPYAIIYHSYRGYRRKGTGLLTRLGNLVRGLVARAAAANIFTSDHSRQVAGTPQARSYVLLNPVDKAMEALYADHRYSEGQLTRKAVGTARRSGDSRRVLRLLFAGRLIEGKGVFDLMDALRRLDGEADLHLTFAGSGPAEDALRQQARTLEHVEVVLAGRLSTQALVAAYEDADVLVVPSSTHKEGNPLVVAEAIYAGTPVVASDQPPMVESIGSAGLLFEVGEAAQLAEVLDRLSRDDELYARVAAEAERRRKVFSYNRYIEDLSCIIHSAFGYIE